MTTGAQLQEAVAKHRSGDLDGAARIYENILAADNKNPDALHLLGLIKHQSGDNDGAAALIEQAMALQPSQAEYVYNLGKVRAAQDRWADLAAANQIAIALKPDHRAAHCNLGVALLWQGQAAEAEKILRGVLEQDVSHAPAWSALGLALLHQCKRDEAAAAWEKSIELEPDMAEAHYNRAMLHLAAMDLARGWPGFAWRARTEPVSFASQAEGTYPFSQPLWRGENLSGKSIFLWGEQGLGDQILFSGLIPDLVAQGAAVVLECEPRLVPLFARSFPTVAVTPRVRPPSTAIAKAVADVQCPLGDLGRYLRADRTSFWERRGYLQANLTHAGALRSKYKALNRDNVLVGVSWTSPRPRFGGFKSTDLVQDWGPVLMTSGITFVCLQYGQVDEALSMATARLKVPVHQDRTVDATRDIDGLAAQIAAMDLVVTVSNSTAHLAGALDVPVWALVPQGPGRLWYWFDGLSYSPWYPSMRLFPQASPGDWGTVFTLVAAKLAAWRAAYAPT